MHNSRFKAHFVILIILSLTYGFTGYLEAQELSSFTTESVSLNYLSPGEVAEALRLNSPNGATHEFTINNSVVQVRFNYAANHVLLSGDKQSIAQVKQIISLLDVAPRQIIIEVKIVEVDNQKFDEIGIDWQNILNDLSIISTFRKAIDTRTSTQTILPDLPRENKSKTDDEDRDGRVSFNAQVGDFLKMVQEHGAGKITNVPRIVTINNKKGTILDGHRILYISKYSSYTNLFETQEITAGLYLAVTPSLGQSGYLRLDVTAKITRLGEIVQGSPSESGQILNNTVIVKDSEAFLLGGLKRTETRKVKKKVPFLGTILPFLFSKNTTIESTRDVLIILTPKIIALNSAEIPKL